MSKDVGSYRQAPRIPSALGLVVGAALRGIAFLAIWAARVGAALLSGVSKSSKPKELEAPWATFTHEDHLRHPDAPYAGHFDPRKN